MMRPGGRLSSFLLFSGIFLLFSYCGIRSPDSEIAYRTGMALIRTGSWAVDETLDWKDFGLSLGVDGRRYSIFGPGHVLLALPFFAAAELIPPRAVPSFLRPLVSPSHFIGTGLGDFVAGRSPEPFDEHFRRTVVSLFNVPVCALALLVFESIVFFLTSSAFAGRLLAALAGFGTILLSYGGTFFSEPAATLFTLISFRFLLSSLAFQPCLSEGRKPRLPLFLGRRLNSETLALFSGMSLGVAVTIHITAVLSLPFFVLIACWAASDLGGKQGFSVKPGLFLLLGCCLFGAVLGGFNFIRFGNFFETGRTVPGLPEDVGYGTFTEPFSGTVGLLLSPGKGLIWYCPLALAGILFWRRFYRSYPRLGAALIAMAAFRILFIAARTDWPGGYCLGPRYLVTIIPFLLLPLGLMAADEEFPISPREATRRPEKLMGTAPRDGWFILLVLSFAHQASFALMEVFTHFHAAKVLHDTKFASVPVGEFLFNDWRTAPFLHFLDGNPAPALLRVTGLPISVLLVLLTFFGAWFFRGLKSPRK